MSSNVFLLLISVINFYYCRFIMSLPLVNPMVCVYQSVSANIFLWTLLGSYGSYQLFNSPCNHSLAFDVRVVLIM